MSALVFHTDEKTYAQIPSGRLLPSRFSPVISHRKQRRSIACVLALAARKRKSSPNPPVLEPLMSSHPTHLPPPMIHVFVDYENLHEVDPSVIFSGPAKPPSAPPEDLMTRVLEHLGKNLDRKSTRLNSSHLVIS